MSDHPYANSVQIRDLEALEDDLIGQLEQLVSQATHIAGMLERVRALRGESPGMNAPRLLIVR